MSDDVSLLERYRCKIESIYKCILLSTNYIIVLLSKPAFLESDSSKIILILHCYSLNSDNTPSWKEHYPDYRALFS